MKAHDIEMIITSRRGKSSSLPDSRKDKGEFKKNSKSWKSSNKESLAASTGKSVRIFRKTKYENKKSEFPKDVGKKRSTLKELQEKKYPFSDSDCQECLTIFFKMELSSSQIQNALKKPEELPTQNIVGIIGWLVTLMRSE